MPTLTIRKFLVTVCLMACASSSLASSLTFSQRIKDVGNDFTKRTSLVDIQYGTAQSQRAKSLSTGNFELAAGDLIDFERWYTTNWKDTSATFLTELTPNLGLIWGLSTGERGKKYKIEPGFTIGVAAQVELAKDVLLSFKASTVISNKLIESPCTADYGEIGGIQSVNCRLAASPLAPEETLNYLVNTGPKQGMAHVRLTWFF